MKVEPLEDNMFEWKCTIKAAVSYASLEKPYSCIFTHHRTYTV